MTEPTRPGAILRAAICLYCGEHMRYDASDEAGFRAARDAMISHDRVCHKNPLVADAERWRKARAALAVQGRVVDEDYGTWWTLWGGEAPEGTEESAFDVGDESALDAYVDSLPATAGGEAVCADCGHHASEHGHRPGHAPGCAALMNGVDASGGRCHCRGFRTGGGAGGGTGR